jgi:hypothetical protein
MDVSPQPVAKRHSFYLHRLVFMRRSVSVASREWSATMLVNYRFVSGHGTAYGSMHCLSVPDGRLCARLHHDIQSDQSNTPFFLPPPSDLQLGFHIAYICAVTSHYQHITNPADNADRDPVHIIGARLHLEY